MTNTEDTCAHCGYKLSDLEYLRSLRVMFATPAYGGMVNANYTLSLSNLFTFAGHENLSYATFVVSNESLITRARNSILSNFIEDTSYTHLFFIDGDIGFNWEDVIKLLLARKDVVTGAYPMKVVDFQQALSAETWQEAQQKSIHYVINPVFKEGTVDEVAVVDGLIAVVDAGTGFMCISREAIDQLLETYGDEIEYKVDQTTVQKSGEVLQGQKSAYALFDTSIDKETGRYLSEDYTFCRRWQSIDGTIWLDPSIILDHYGTYTFRGYHYLQGATPVSPEPTSSS